MVDNTDVVIDICNKVGAKPDDKGAEEMLHDPKFHEELSKKAEEFAPLADKEWEEYFHGKGNDNFSRG